MGGEKKEERERREERDERGGLMWVPVPCGRHVT
jgi:hypothetical protein